MNHVIQHIEDAHYMISHDPHFKEIIESPSKLISNKVNELIKHFTV